MLSASHLNACFLHRDCPSSQVQTHVLVCLCNLTDVSSIIWPDTYRERWNRKEKVLERKSASVSLLVQVSTGKYYTELCWCMQMSFVALSIVWHSKHPHGPSSQQSAAVYQKTKEPAGETPRHRRTAAINTNCEWLVMGINYHLDAKLRLNEQWGQKINQNKKLAYFKATRTTTAYHLL